MLHPIYARLIKHRAFLLLLLVFITFRVLSLITLQPGGFIRAGGPDQSYSFDIGRLAGSGQLPFFNFWTEYPPLMPWIAALAYRLSLFFAPWVVPIFWFNLIFRFLLLPFDIATLVLIYRSANLFYSPDKALFLAALWALFFAPLFTFLAWFDPIALFFLILGLYGLLTQRSILSGVALGLGFMAKIVPIVIWPIGWLALRGSRQRITYLVSTLVAIGLVALPPLLVAPQYLIAFFRSLSSVSSWETIWALLEGYRGYGLVAPLTARNDPLSALFSIHPSTLPWPIITLIFVLIYLIVITRSIDWRDQSKIALGALFSFALALLYNKGYSPQWATYLGTLAILALPLRRGTIYALLLSLFYIAEWPIAFVLFEGQDQVLIIVIVLRTTVIIFLCIEAVSRLVSNTPLALRIQRAMSPLSVAITIGGFLLAIPLMWSAYMTNRLEAEPLSPWLESLAGKPQSHEPIVLIQPELLERLHPYLPENPMLLMPNVNGLPWVQPDKWLKDALATDKYAWFIYDTAFDKSTTNLFKAASTWLNQSSCLIDQQSYESVQVQLYAVAFPPPEQAINRDFQNGLHLLTATIPATPLIPGAVMCLKLTWHADTALHSDDAMFVHLLNADGQVVAQSDLWPMVPSSQWPAGYKFTLNHVFEVPADLKSGNYDVEVGVYNIADGQRLLLMDSHDTLYLAEVNVK
jgi:glycosyl transferase family 87